MSPITRRRLLLAAAGIGTGVALGGHTTWADETADVATTPAFRPEPQRAGTELITADAQRAIARAIAFLKAKQVTAGRGKGCFGAGGYASGVAVCSLSGLAFMTAGSAPGEGPLGKHIDRCIEFIIRSTQPTGYIAPGAGHSNDQMYGHGLATLFLAQVYGMTDREDAGDKLRKAVELICSCQNDEGGWRYQPTKSSADLSITICQINALRAARDAGLHVPIEIRNNCMKYVMKCQTSTGVFQYTLKGGRKSVALTAAGVVSLYSAGVYEGPEIESAIKWLKENPMHTNTSRSTVGRNYYYAMYYAAQAMWQIGGDTWKDWYTALRDKLIGEQAGDGSWTDPSIGQEFATAIALITLNTPNNYLPIFAK